MNNEINKLENSLVQLGCDTDTLYTIFIGSKGPEEYAEKLKLAILKLRG